MGSFISLLIFFLSHKYNTGLSLPKIFSTFQALTIVSYAFLSLTLAFAGWNQINVIFERFAAFFNYENTQMLNIDSKLSFPKILVDKKSS
jgi:hypothetical protein